MTKQERRHHARMIDQAWRIAIDPRFPRAERDAAFKEAQRRRDWLRSQPLPKGW